MSAGEIAQAVWDGVSSSGVTNIVTAGGVLLAIWLARRASIERRQDTLAAHLAEARLFRLTALSISTVGSGQGIQYQVHFRAELLSEWPITDVRYQAWPGGLPLTAEPVQQIKSAMIHTSNPELYVPVPENVDEIKLDGSTIQAWRLLWRDRHGNQWVVDERDQISPRRFVPGEKPTPRPFRPW